MKARKKARQEKGKIKEELTKVMVKKKDLKAKRTQLKRLDTKYM